jgi:hypothetical protein
MKRYRAFIPTALLVGLAWWPFAVYPMTRTSTFWAFYLTTPLTVIAFIALAAGIVLYRKSSN